MHAAYQIIGDLTASSRKKLYAHCQTDTSTFSFRLGQQLFTLGMVTLAWVFFRAESLSAACSMILSIFKGLNLWNLFDGTLLTLGLDSKDWDVLLISISLMLAVSVLQQRGSVRERLQKQTTCRTTRF